MRIESFLENTAALFPHKTAIRCGSHRYSYIEVNQCSDRLSINLVESGFKPGERALIFCTNSPVAVVSLFAVLKAGGIFSIVNPHIKPFKLNYLLKNSGAKALIIKSKFIPILKDSLRGVTNLKTMIWSGAREPLSSDLHKLFPFNCLHYDQLVASECKGTKLNSTNHFRSDMDLATIIYTSGSTGKPKGVMCPHRSMIAALESIIDYLALRSDDTVIVMLPLAFDYGLYQVLMTFKVGGTIIMEQGLDYPQKLFQIIKNERVTVLPIVPTLANILLAKSRLKPLSGYAVRAITNTSAALTPRQISSLQSIFPKALIYAMYGLTECKRVSYLPPNKLGEKQGSVGRPMRGVKTFIVDTKGDLVAPGEIGELLIQGPNVMEGYWNDPEATARVFKRNPNTGAVTLHSGDLFREDAERFLYFVDRKDSMLKIRGERIYPLEIENVLHQIPNIREAVIIGLSNENGDTYLVAAIEGNHRGMLSEKEIRAYCRQQLEPYLIPRQIIFFDEIPKLPNGKVDKQSLTDLFTEANISRMREVPPDNKFFSPSHTVKANIRRSII